MDEQLPHGNDFGGGDFLEDIGGLSDLEGLGGVPNVGDITLEGGEREPETGGEGKGLEVGDEDREMEMQANGITMQLT